MIAGLSVAPAVYWIAVDRTPPAWDQSHYLWDSIQYADAFRQGGVGGVIHAFFSVERFYGPAYPALLFPFMAVLGPSTQSALMANLCLWIVFLVTVAAIARQLFGKAAGLIAMAVTTTIPILLVLLHQALVDLAALTWTFLAVLAMFRSAHFKRPIPAAFAGLFAGIGLLTKATVLVFLMGPVVVMGLRAALRLRAAPTGQRLRVVGNMMLGVGVAITVAAPWYVTNWDSTLGYFQSATVGDLSIGVGPDNPLDPAALARVGVIVLGALSWSVAGGMVAVGAVLVWNRTRSVRASPPVLTNHGRHMWGWLLLLAWISVPLAVFADAHNQDPRQAAVIFPCLALVFAGLCAMTQARWRLWAVVAVLTIGLAQVGFAQLPLRSDTRNGADSRLTAGSAHIFLKPIYPPADPAADDGTPVMLELEALANGRPARVLVAESDRVFNINTLKWLAATRHDQFTFLSPDMLTGDPSELSSYDLAIYLPASAVAQRNPGPRTRFLNKTMATTVFGDQLFSIFGASRHEVALRRTTVWVLQR